MDLDSVPPFYMRTEAMPAGDNRPHGSKGTIADPEYLKALNEADLSIKTAFREAEHEEFNEEFRLTTPPRSVTMIRFHLGGREYRSRGRG